MGPPFTVHHLPARAGGSVSDTYPPRYELIVVRCHSCRDGDHARVITGARHVPTARRGALDALVAVWCVFWVVLGTWIGQQMWQVSKLTDTVADSGHALHQAGEALMSFAGLPLVGERSAALGGTVTQNADQIVQGATDAQRSTRRLAVLLGLSIVLVPLAPVLGFYVPTRRRAARDATDVRRLLSTEDGDVVDALLAQRAVGHLPYSALLAYTPTPAADLRDGRFGPLADAELAHLGLRRRTGQVKEE
ncbi:MAG: hypothetical protein QOF57_801 [Frankiaceae bacterium]|nr:hypothetical protein [Frankiaceae bacterium]